MRQSFLYRWFGVGKVPKGAAANIEQETVVFRQEGLSGSIGFRNFRAPGRRHGAKRSWFIGSLVLTEQHLLGFGFSQQVLGLAWDSPQASKLKIFVEGEFTLCVQYEGADFNPDWSGEVTVRYRLEKASRIAQDIKRRIRQAK